MHKVSLIFRLLKAHSEGTDLYQGKRGPEPDNFQIYSKLPCSKTCDIYDKIKIRSVFQKYEPNCRKCPYHNVEEFFKN